MPTTPPEIALIGGGHMARALVGGWVARGIPAHRLRVADPSALYAAGGVDFAQRELAGTLLDAVGATTWVDDEAHLDAVTAVSGSGPAYFFLLIELLEDAARRQGLTPEVARRLAIETAYGAARMARESADDAATLRVQVTSKGGTTAAALAVLESAGLRDIVCRAVEAATQRSRELAADFGRD